jgi:ribose/xylose/arabinose/galactoside ABC-type transport system permease subunit
MTSATVTRTGVSSSGSRWSSIARRLLSSPEVAVVVILVVFVAYGMTQSSQFGNPDTWINILRNAAFIAIVGCGTTYVLISGGLDLSIGSVFMAGAVAAAAVAQAGHSPGTAVLAGLLVGVIVGLINGVLVNYAQISAIIVTLGTLFAVRALAVTATGGSPIGPLPESFTVIGQGSLFGIPLLIYYALVIIVVAYIVLQFTSYGWNIRAVGGNALAARSMGINTRRLSTSVYIIGGALAGLAGVLMAARLGSGPPSLGAAFELQVIAAAIIGGTSIYGSIGSIPGTVLGALLLSVLTTGLVILKVDPAMQNFAIGVVIIVAAGLDRFRKAQMFKASARVSQHANQADMETPKS